MKSILLISENRKSAKEYINKLLSHEKVDPIDTNINSFEKTVGIEDVRNIQKKIFLKPLRSKTKAVVIESYDGITIESQNALLKILEEPPNNTIIVIVANKIGPFLPTILSRCKIIELKKESVELSEREISSYLNFLISLPESSIGERLKLAQDAAKNKDEAVPWLEKLILATRQKLIEDIFETSSLQRLNDLNHLSKTSSSISKYHNILVSLQKTYKILKTTNVNPRIALENLFLNL